MVKMRQPSAKRGANTFCVQAAQVTYRSRTGHVERGEESGRCLEAHHLDSLLAQQHFHALEHVKLTCRLGVEHVPAAVVGEWFGVALLVTCSFESRGLELVGVGWSWLVSSFESHDVSPPSTSTLV